ncbi:25607_t:CDS:1, partial [Gigaspora rosea]
TPELTEEKPTPKQLETNKYNKLLKAIKAEIDPEKLKDSSYYGQEINKLDYQLLTLEKQPQYLQEARTEC